MLKNKNNWYFTISFLICLTLVISLSPWLFELLATPAGRVFSGINRWSNDYFIYLSYVEQGKNGFFPVKLLITTAPHAALFSHLSYTIPGFIFGHLLSINSVFIYHFMRAFYGFLFLWVVIAFFYKITRDKYTTIIAFILSFYISGFAKIDRLWPLTGARYLDWLQEQNIIGRATGPLHYNTGFIVFISVYLYYFYSKSKPLFKILILALLLNLSILTNPFNYQLLAFVFFIYIAGKLVVSEKNIKLLREVGIVAVSFLLSAPLLYYFYFYLSSAPWGVVGVAPKFYVVTTPDVSLFEAALSVGPIFFLGIAGYILILKRFFVDKKNAFNLTGAQLSFLFIWPSVQFILLIFGNQLKIHPPRAFSGLYFLPLSIFSAFLIIESSIYLKKIFKINKVFSTVLIISILFILTLPNFILSYQEQLYAFTDFKSFQSLSYPTIKQAVAYQYLEKNTKARSGVMAMFEANSQIIAYAGNSVEFSVPNEQRVLFYSGLMPSDDAYRLLKKYHFQYVYDGYQEMSVGGNLSNYLFLKQIFENGEVKIYKVI